MLCFFFSGREAVHLHCTWVSHHFTVMISDLHLTRSVDVSSANSSINLFLLGVLYFYRVLLSFCRCNSRFTHANRHCSDHPYASLRRCLGELALQPVTNHAPENSPDVLNWLENYKKRNEEKTPAKISNSGKFL